MKYLKTEMPELKTISQMVKIVDLTEYRIRQLLKQNKVKYIMAGKKFLVNVNSLIDYLNTGDNPTTCEINSNDLNYRKGSI